MIYRVDNVHLCIVSLVSNFFLEKKKLIFLINLIEITQSRTVIEDKPCQRAIVKTNVKVTSIASDS